MAPVMANYPDLFTAARCTQGSTGGQPTTLRPPFAAMTQGPLNNPPSVYNGTPAIRLSIGVNARQAAEDQWQRF